MANDGIPIYRPRPGQLLGVRIAAVGGYVPEQIVTNADLARLGCDEEWILKRTGIAARRHAAPDQATSDLAILAAQDCLKQAGMTSSEVDMLIVATFTPDYPVPSTACLVQAALQLQAPAMDIQAACSGFVYALVTGMQFVASGCARQVLVVGADCNTRAVNPDDKQIYPLFGDGAGAVLLTAGSPTQGLLSYVLGADGRGASLLCQALGGSRQTPTTPGARLTDYYLAMDGRSVFKWAVTLVADSIRQVLDHAGLAKEEIAWFLPHQANVRIIQAAAEELGIPLDKVWINLDRLGNTSAASIPLCLKDLQTLSMNGRPAQPGDKLLFCGFGAGLTWGTAVYRC